MMASKHSYGARHADVMGGGRAQFPLHITPATARGFARAVDEVYDKTGFEGEHLAHATYAWADSVKRKQYHWLGMAGALTSVGFGGIVADLMRYGLIDCVVTTGAMIEHDMHYIFGLPVRHGTDKVDDDKLRRQKRTRIHTQQIHNLYTLQLQDRILQDFGAEALKELEPPYSSAEFLDVLAGKILRHEGKYKVVDERGSMLLTAKRCRVPIYLDSHANHTIGMNLAKLGVDGYNADMSTKKDVIEAAAYTMRTQPQFNILMGEGGPRNFVQTTGPTAAEIFGLDFEGSEGGLMFTTGEPWWGSLTGSTFSEAVTWGKYLTAMGLNKVVVRGEATITVPIVAGAVMAKCGRQPLKRLADKREEVYAEFMEQVHSKREKLLRRQERLLARLPHIRRMEVELRRAAGDRYVRQA